MKSKSKRRPLYPCPKCGDQMRVEKSMRKDGLQFPYRYRICINKKCRYRLKTEEKGVETQ